MHSFFLALKAQNHLPDKVEAFKLLYRNCGGFSNTSLPN